ncbi:hypothetical protein HPB50_020441 [Hyalomma asiaticum]|uniref:Uncharacterized protein n=1 Tax=Hyalomma asiaticum TaxID=266040 RepID=A0ACB7S6P0_HYAAI|nr:hypothetical protein HPB50_020441 [Hyalomma asiaticum]
MPDTTEKKTYRLRTTVAGRKSRTSPTPRETLNGPSTTRPCSVLCYSVSKKDVDRPVNWRPAERCAGVDRLRRSFLRRASKGPGRRAKKEGGEIEGSGGMKNEERIDKILLFRDKADKRGGSDGAERKAAPPSPRPRRLYAAATDDASDDAAVRPSVKRTAPPPEARNDEQAKASFGTTWHTSKQLALRPATSALSADRKRRRRGSFTGRSSSPAATLS